MGIWLARVAWITLPVTAGAGASDAISGLDDAPRAVAAVLLFASWGGGVLAVLAPRPVGLTALRTVAPAYVALAIVAVALGDASGLAGWGGLAAVVTAALLVVLPDVSRASADGVAYGDEERYPLRVPPGLFLGPLPAARVAAVAPPVAGPLLLANGDIAWGVLVIAAGAPLALLATRMLHGLSRRWLVLVPAGVVVVDPMSLAEPVLLVRRQVRAMRPVAASIPVAGDVVDLRLGASAGNLLVELGEPVDLVRRGSRGHGAVTTKARRLLVAVVLRGRLLDAAAGRRVRTASRA